MKYVYTVVESGRAEFHRFGVKRSPEGVSSGLIVAEYRWRFIAEQTANFLSGADDRDEFVSQTLKPKGETDAGT
jgi:hypothetical protein